MDNLRVKLPPVGMLTVRAPALMPYSPTAVTVTLTGNAAVGAGVAVMTNVTSAPSLPPAADVMFTSGGGTSLMDAVWEESEPTV